MTADEQPCRLAWRCLNDVKSSQPVSDPNIEQLSNEVTKAENITCLKSVLANLLIEKQCLYNMSLWHKRKLAIMTSLESKDTIKPAFSDVKFTSEASELN